jgi:hypothetical protein
LLAKILKDAGWTYDGSAHTWNNAPAKQTLDTITLRTSNVPELKNIASAVKKSWEQLGIPSQSSSTSQATFRKILSDHANMARSYTAWSLDATKTSTHSGIHKNEMIPASISHDTQTKRLTRSSKTLAHH